MPVSNEDRATYTKLSDADRNASVQTHLKAIREGSTGPGVMDHVAINNALDHIEVLTKQPANAPAAKPGTLGGPSANPAPFATSNPHEPNAALGTTQHGTVVQPV